MSGLSRHEDRVAYCGYLQAIQRHGQTVFRSQENLGGDPYRRIRSHDSLVCAKRHGYGLVEVRAIWPHIVHLLDASACERGTEVSRGKLVDRDRAVESKSPR